MIQHYVVEALVWAYIHIDAVALTMFVVVCTVGACFIDRKNVKESFKRR